jgi:hypothetical protein
MLALIVLGLLFFREAIFTVSTKQAVKVNKVSLVPFFCGFIVRKCNICARRAGLVW